LEKYNKGLIVSKLMEEKKEEKKKWILPITSRELTCTSTTSSVMTTFLGCLA